jgi:hypothetical protein
VPPCAWRVTGGGPHLRVEQTTLPQLAHRSNQTTGFDAVMHACAEGRRPPFKPDHTLHCHFRSKCALLSALESKASKQPKECHLPAPWGQCVILLDAASDLWAKSRQQMARRGFEALDIAKRSGDEHGPLQTAHD